jgi:hypothetical protein
MIAGAVAIVGIIAWAATVARYSARIDDMREVAGQLEPVARESILWKAPSKMGPPYWIDDYGCDRRDCAVVIEGWRWGVKNRVWTEDDCAGSGSDAFHAGCRLYLKAIGRADLRDRS